MNVSSRTPEGDPHRCAICGRVVVMETEEPLGDSVCPRCGALFLPFQKTFSQQLGIDRRRITPETALTELGNDSLDTVELVMELEEELDVSIPDIEAENIQTIADLIRAILRQRGYFDDDEQRW